MGLTAAQANGALAFSTLLEFLDTLPAKDPVIEWARVVVCDAVARGPMTPEPRNTSAALK